MIKLRKVIDSPCGVRYMVDALELRSGASRQALLDSVMMYSREEIVEYYSKLAEFQETFFSEGGNKHALNSLHAELSSLKDAGGSISRLLNGAILEDTDFFELKVLALLGETVTRLLSEAGITSVRIPEMVEAIRILDPEGNRVPSFHVYDAYSEKLAALRKKIKSEHDSQDLVLESLVLEAEVRVQLSDELRLYAGDFAGTLQALTLTDILLAKVHQVNTMGLIFPVISETGMTRYTNMFHPATNAMLQRQGKQFQPVDIMFDRVPTVIIGANMGGKTVVLKMLALNQYLFQFGFGIPAAMAEIDVKEDIRLLIGEEQGAERGLSSFGAEVVGINEIIMLARKEKRCLMLIDEPARTTNPVEGTALVEALIGVLGGTGSDTVITSHYDLKDITARRLKVAGLRGGVMDYSLVETSSSEVPHEALTIASSLGADESWIKSAEDILKKRNKYKIAE